MIRTLFALAMLCSLALAPLQAQTPEIDAKKKELEQLVQDMGNAASTDEYNQMLERYNALNREIKGLMADHSAATNKDKACAQSINSANDCLRSRDYACARDMAQRAIESCPDNPKAHYTLGLAEARLGNDSAAQAAYGQATTADPGYYKAWFSLGKLHGKAGRSSAAHSAYDKALEINPSYAKAWYEKGLLEFNERDFGNAAKHFAKATDADASYTLAHEALGKTYIELKQCSKAITALDKALKDRGNRNIASAWYYKSHALNMCGRFNEAMQAAENCLEKLGSLRSNKAFVRGGAHFEKGTALAAQSSWQPALASFERATQERAWRDQASWEIDRIKKEQGL